MNLLIGFIFLSVTVGVFFLGVIRGASLCSERQSHKTPGPLSSTNIDRAA